MGALFLELGAIYISLFMRSSLLAPKAFPVGVQAPMLDNYLGRHIDQETQNRLFDTSVR